MEATRPERVLKFILRGQQEHLRDLEWNLHLREIFACQVDNQGTGLRDESRCDGLKGMDFGVLWEGGMYIGDGWMETNPTVVILQWIQTPSHWEESLR